MSKYKKKYDDLIAFRIANPYEGYTESHHIIPKCMGGPDIKSNKVRLSAREHYIAHLMLVKIYPKEYGLIKAANMMCIFSKTNPERVGNKRYAWVSKLMSIAMSKTQLGENNSNYGNVWMSNPDKRINAIAKSDAEVDELVAAGFVRGRNVWNKIDREAKLELSKKENALKKEKQLQDKIKLANEMNTYLEENGYEKTMIKYNKNHKSGIAKFLSKYSTEFSPQNGKARSKK
jgi:hypothetical protein